MNNIPESTVQKLTNPRDRGILSLYRQGTHRLVIKSEQHGQTYKLRESRLCQQCALGTLVDDDHFLLQILRLSNVFPNF